MHILATLNHTLQKYRTVILFTSIAFFTVIVLRSAWLGDDAYITFRTIKNFVNGYGLVWNIDERVQTYTHPLWLFLLSSVFFVTKEIYYSTLVTSLFISVMAVTLFSFAVNRHALPAFLGILVFSLSKAFVDYSTSGLENPLTHLILIIFLIIYLKRPVTLKNQFILTLVASLGILNRMDTILLYAPVLSYGMLKLKSFRGILVTGAGFTPFFLWEIFSLFYYGFPFPNTAYAKLNASASQTALIEQGFYYLLNSLRLDPLTLTFIIVGVTLPWFSRESKFTPPVLGIILYLLYTIKIGGDFMSGRFLTAPLLVSVVTVAALANLPRKQYHHIVPIVLIFITLVLGIISPYSPIWSNADYGTYHPVTDLRGIADERSDYYQETGLLNTNKGIPESLKNEFSVEAQEYQNSDLLTLGGIGLIGFYAKPELYIIDRYALTDPLLARLSPLKINLHHVRLWPELTRMGNRPGHFRRVAPKGYLETIEPRQNMLVDPNLSFYYDKLSLITRGQLSDPKRIPVIIEFNFGKYDHLLETFQTSYQIELPARTTLISFESINNITTYHAVDILFPEPIHVQIANITYREAKNVEQNKIEYQEYWLGFIKDDYLLALEEFNIPPEAIEFFPGRIIIPTLVRDTGFDRVVIAPRKTRNEYISNDFQKIKTIELVN